MSPTRHDGGNASLAGDAHSSAFPAERTVLTQPGQTSIRGASSLEAERRLPLGESSLPNSQTDAALFTKLVDRLAPWLFEVGSWTFGGLIATTMLILAALFTIGPVDVAVAVSTAAFAVALPLDVTGLVLVRIVRNLTRFEDSLFQVFQESGVAMQEQLPSANALARLRQRRPRVALGFDLGFLVLSLLVTAVGLSAIFWHMAWWIAVAFVLMVLAGVGVGVIAIVSPQLPTSAAKLA